MLLQKFGLYHRLKASTAYDLYWRIVDPGILEHRQGEIDFYASVLAPLPKDALVFDVGANLGWKSDIFLRLGAHVVAVEPDDTNQAVLTQKFLSYRLFPKSITVVPKALGAADAAATMFIDAPGSAKNTLSSKWVETLRHDEDRFGYALTFSDSRTVATTTLDRLIETYGRPWFVKIDVEGHELNVIRGLHHPVPHLSFEVNLPEFLDEGVECVHLLEALSSDGLFNYTIDCGRGLAMPEWLSALAFAERLASCNEPSLEVFWRTRQ